MHLKDNIRRAAARSRQERVDKGAVIGAVVAPDIEERAVLRAAAAAEIRHLHRRERRIRLLVGERIGENVNAYLRTEEVGNMASVSSAVPRVREKLLSLQRKLAKDMSVVMDGRDIGTTILPDADVKIYLTASSLTRAKRRYLELQEKGTVCDLDNIQKDIEERDQRDMNREISPLRQAEDAVLVDSSDLTIEQVVDRILEIFRARTEEGASHES